MTRIIMNGCNGAMGQTITRIVEGSEDARIVAGVDPRDGTRNAYPVFRRLRECDKEADAVIDFSTAEAVDELLEECVSRGLPLVLCTTGLSEGQLARVRESGEKIPILRSANMSLGINLLLKLLGEVAPLLESEGFDAEIVERHHNQKMDAPSGTALALADAIREADGGEPYEYVLDRSARRQKRPKREIGISSVRGGTIVGEHEVIFAGMDEVIELRHVATSKAVFAKGAVAAAKFLAGKEPGLYDMSDVIRL